MGAGNGNPFYAGLSNGLKRCPAGLVVEEGGWEDVTEVRAKGRPGRFSYSGDRLREKQNDF